MSEMRCGLSGKRHRIEGNALSSKNGFEPPLLFNGIDHNGDSRHRRPSFRPCVKTSKQSAGTSPPDLPARSDHFAGIRLEVYELPAVRRRLQRQSSAPAIETFSNRSSRIRSKLLPLRLQPVLFGLPDRSPDRPVFKGKAFEENRSGGVFPRKMHRLRIVCGRLPERRDCRYGH